MWHRTDDGQLEERYNLADALAVATYLNIFVRHCQTVRMANLAQLVNVIAPIVTSSAGLFLQTIYHPFRLMAAATREVALAHMEEMEAGFTKAHPGVNLQSTCTSRSRPAAPCSPPPPSAPGPGADRGVHLQEVL